MSDVTTFSHRVVQRVLLSQVVLVHMDPVLPLFLVVYFYFDLQVSTGSQPPSGW